jgi:HKD family nuclease
MFELGLYEQLLNKLVSEKINTTNIDNFFIQTSQIEKAEASTILTNYCTKIIKFALDLINSEDSIQKQIELINKIILILENEIQKQDFTQNLVDLNGNLLKAVLPKIDSNIVNFDNYIKEITPYTGLTQSEIKKEILSSDKIYLLVSFIKWSGIRIFEKELREFTNQGKKLKIITTSYMGATDLKAVEFLASLPNTEIKVSYNTANERLHAKSYLFFRNTGFHTGYIGSSNISKSALTSGLEWNLKVTTAEISHIIKKFEKTFETYWEDKEFEIFTGEQKEKLQIALKNDSIENQNKF